MFGKRLYSTILTLLLSASTYAADSTSAFHQLLDEHWANANQEQLFFRKDPDAFRMNGKLPDVSAAGRERRAKFNQQMLDKLAKIDLNDLSEQDQLSYRLFRYERQTEAKSYQQFDYMFPMNIYAGYHTYFGGAPNNMSFLTKADYDNYLISLADFPRYNQQHIVNLKAAIDKGYTHYCGAFADYDKTISHYIVDDVTTSEFYAPFANMPARFSAADKAAYESKGRKLIHDTVIPEYQRLYDFFTQQYMPNCRKNVGISQLEDGKDYYQYLIEYYTTTSMSADEIHQLGLDEVKRIRQQMEQIIQQVGFKGDFKQFVQFLRTDPQFYTTTARDLLEKASYISRKMAGQLPKWFGKLPRNTFDIKSSPNDGAFYVGSDGSGTTSGTYFVGTTNLKASPLYNLEALTYHESIPGHHLQGALAKEMAIPEFRKSLSHSAFSEGWALYSESLGKEMGFYQDPYSDFGRLTYEAWRACRLVVDTGMHAMGWSREKAIDYLAANTALTMPEVTNQIDRYITWPAQALSYKIGELKIRELRNKAEAELGEKFDVRAFHDQILKNGSLPLDLLEELTLEWIEKAKSSSE
ncbi:DUF885 domain-containing protein [Neptunicella sp.]|uniref:DUF885 domain-containing protein n=1 Tax=Neptunicella sp. TaxID=2125986 RepID=UPI003F68E3F8